MKYLRFFTGILILLLFIGESSSATAKTNEISENAYRANNLGVAFLEQYKHEEAVAQFRQALQLKTDFDTAKLNLAIALFNAQKLAESKQIAEEILQKFPASLQANYILGLIFRTENNRNEAFEAFQKVLAVDASDVGANVNIGQILLQQKDYEEAQKHFQTAYESEPYNTTAVYNLAITLQRKGDKARAAELLKTFQTLRDNGAGTSIGLNYLEQGRYAEAVTSTGLEDELVDKSAPKVLFQEINIGLPLMKNPSKFLSDAAFIDFDNDGDLDIVQISPPKIFRNDRGKFVDATSSGGDFARLNVAKSADNLLVSGDYDNDNQPDLFVMNGKRKQLFHNEGGGKFKDVTKDAKIPQDWIASTSIAFVDTDHDGDLDIFIANSAGKSNQLLRNNGDGTFTDYSKQSKLGIENSVLQVIPTDFDNRRDIDLLLLNKTGKPALFRNLRDTTFKNVAEDVGLNTSDKWNCAAVGDFNKDAFVDFFLGRKQKTGLLAISDGKGNFTLRAAPKGTENAAAAQFFDYDNDGLLDLLVSTPKGLLIARNLGSGFAEASAKPFKSMAKFANAHRILSADLDDDGDLDLLIDGSFLQNNGGNINKAETLRLQGRVSNKTAIGAKIDMRSGSLTQKLESYSASPMPSPSEIHFGLGQREKPDAIRIIWTSGIIQAETDFPSATAKNSKPFAIEELDRKPSSCPYLYTWNGEKFEFITDFLGGGEMGDWMSQGTFNTSDSDEFVRIPPEKLKPKNGRYEIRVTNELEEVMYLDQVKLVAVEHDKNSEVYPNEGLGIQNANQNILYTTHNEHAPLSAVDRDGTDVLPKIRTLDRNFYDSFTSQKIRGYADEHALTIKLDDLKNYRDRTLLLLTGWTDYAFSSDNVAASQSGKSLTLPYLQVKDKNGNWQTAIDSIGISIGRPQTVVVDLTDKFLTDSREVRIVTSYKTYWDKISVDTSAQSETEKIELKPLQADLHERGFSAEKIVNKMIVADYDQVNFEPKWKNFVGSFTRTGDVRELLNDIDDNFVIAKTGDEFVLSFPELPAPAADKKYTFLLYADGFSKEMDINSGSPESVFPLPFHKMSKYPYGANEQYPWTNEKREMFEKYNTRKIFRTFDSIDFQGK